MNMNVGDILNGNPENGIWLDYENHIWYFFVKDDVWTKEEVRNAEKNPLHVRFVSRGKVDLFLVEIEDCLECSDIPFSAADGDEKFLASLKDHSDYAYRVILADGAGKICVVRYGALGEKNSQKLKDILNARLSEGVTSEEAEAAYAKLAETTEPFEMEEDAVFTVTA